MGTSAPRPGSSSAVPAAEAAAQVDAAKRILTIPYGDETYRLAWNNVAMQERIICRKATGLPVEAFTGALDTQANMIGEDTMCVLWWLARRASGEWQLTFTRASDEWDVNLLGTIEVEEPDVTEADPES